LRLSQRQKIPLQDDQPSAAFQRKSEHLTEIMIQGDEDSGLAGADFEQRFVLGALEILVSDGRHVVPRCS
jgi:hypothetical protein